MKHNAARLNKDSGFHFRHLVTSRLQRACSASDRLRTGEVKEVRQQISVSQSAAY
jgi:hypothetical protein